MGYLRKLIWNFRSIGHITYSCLYLSKKNDLDNAKKRVCYSYVFEPREKAIEIRIQKKKVKIIAYIQEKGKKKMMSEF